MNYRKSDRLPWYRFYRALQWQKSPMRYIREIFRAPRFSSFSTWGNSGIEPDKGKGISSPGTY
jgi:transposase